MKGMKKVLLMFLSIFLFSSFIQRNPYALRVSLINLISTPEKFDNKPITVKGYYSHRFESTRLYLDEISARNNIYENSVTIILDSSINEEMMKAKDNSYMQVEGYFKMPPPNNKNSYGNYIQKVYNIDDL